MVVSSGLEEQEQDKSGQIGSTLDSTDVSIFVIVLVELTYTGLIDKYNSTNITTNIERAALSCMTHPSHPMSTV